MLKLYEREKAVLDERSREKILDSNNTEDAMKKDVSNEKGVTRGVVKNIIFFYRDENNDFKFEAQFKPELFSECPQRLSVLFTCWDDVPFEEKEIFVTDYKMVPRRLGKDAFVVRDQMLEKADFEKIEHILKTGKPEVVVKYLPASSKTNIAQKFHFSGRIVLPESHFDIQAPSDDLDFLTF